MELFPVIAICNSTDSLTVTMSPSETLHKQDEEEKERHELAGGWAVTYVNKTDASAPLVFCPDPPPGLERIQAYEQTLYDVRRCTVTHSYAERTDMICPHCGQPFSAEVWLIVDTSERPDLAGRCRDNTIHTLTCPHCGHQGQVDAPLLVYQPPAGSEPAGGSARLLFVPPAQTSSEEDQELAGALLALLRERLGVAWDDALVEQLQPVPRELLPVALTEDAEEREAALREMARAAQESLEALRREDPEAYRRLEEAAREMMQATPLLNTLQQFIQARTWADSRRILEQHPELLSDESDNLLARLIAAAREQGEEDGERLLAEHRDLLRRCRVVGIERAFAALTPRPPLPLAGEGEAERSEAGGEGLLTTLPDDLRDDLVEVMANVSSQEEWEQALEEQE